MTNESYGIVASNPTPNKESTWLLVVHFDAIVQIFELYWIWVLIQKFCPTLPSPRWIFIGTPPLPTFIGNFKTIFLPVSSDRSHKGHNNYYKLQHFQGLQQRMQRSQKILQEKIHVANCSSRDIRFNCLPSMFFSETLRIKNNRELNSNNFLYLMRLSWRNIIGETIFKQYFLRTLKKIEA